MRRREITNRDVEQAIAWRAQGMKWRDIGRLIAARKGRSMPFRENSLMHACRPFMENAPTKDLASHD